MKDSQQLQQAISVLPEAIRKLVPQPTLKEVSFANLTQNNINDAVKYVKTKTLLSMLKPTPLPQKDRNCKEAPIILVLCIPSEQLTIQKNEIYPFVPVSYSQWLQSAGARCVPLAYNLNEASMQFLLERSHGMLIPGGGANLYKSYEDKQGYGPFTIGFLKIWRYIQKMWSKGVYFPVWGTCLGLQVALIAISNDIKILSNLNSRGHQLQVYSEYHQSNIFKNMPINLRLQIQNRKLMNNFHMHGISVKKFMSSPKIKEKLKIISISKDKDGRWFCSGIEGKDNPIFLSQFHPEKQSFQWTKKGDVLHNKYSIELSHYFAQAFISECRKCKPQKQFIDQKQIAFYSIHQYRQIYTPQKLYKVYAIDYKFRQYHRDQKRKTTSMIKPQTTSKKIIL